MRWLWGFNCLEHLYPPIGPYLATWIIENDYSRLWLTSIASRIINKSHRTMGKSILSLFYHYTYYYPFTVAGSSYVNVIANTFDHCLGAWLFISVKKCSSDQTVNPLIKKKVIGGWGDNWLLLWIHYLLLLQNWYVKKWRIYPMELWKVMELDFICICTCIKTEIGLQYYRQVSKNALSNRRKLLKHCAVLI